MHKRQQREQDEMMVAHKLRQLFDDSRCIYRSRRLKKALKIQGIEIGRHKVRRLMQDLSLVVRYPKRFKVTTDSRHSESISPIRWIGNFVLANLIRYGQQTSRMCGHYRAGCMLRWSSTYFRGKSWVGQWLII
ncbi:MAG: transposase [Moraxellaceae bacterium]|nr:transposase [Moraxellaceae bacterium]